MSKRTFSKDEVIERVQNVFPKSEIMFIYYCGSIAFGLDDENSDVDVTAVLDNFNGNIHLSLGDLDIFAFGQDVYMKKQEQDSSVALYYRAYMDEILSTKDNLIYLNSRYQNEYERYKNTDFNKILGPFLNSFVVQNEVRLKDQVPYKSHYHILRVRGILDHVDRVGKYELIVEEPWYSQMIEYKKNWDKEIGIKYMPVLERELRYIAEYRDKVMKDELG